MTIAYESGVNLFDTAEVYAGGRWALLRRHGDLLFFFNVVIKVRGQGSRPTAAPESVSISLAILRGAGGVSLFNNNELPSRYCGGVKCS